MELKQIKELMGAMVRSGITKVVLKKEGEFELQIERQSNEFVDREQAHSFLRSEYGSEHPHALPSVRTAEPLFTHNVATVSTTPAEEAGRFITSPMVGTFYSSPSPDDPPFVRVGDKVDANTVVCIVEAMKVMNEVKAGISGTVTEVLLASGSPVEFGTKIFRVV
ncbi:MAG: acetyl-CoA carboxylase biotin carboxyl carrier protein [Chlamydiales bacterium]|nr:acetyl-CoA carboxylase biotin carboxyl carrier protein [Chlamydiales bacterium]